MKRLFRKQSMTIKMKVTLWYTCFVTIITLLSLAFLILSSNHMTESILKERLKSSVESVKYSIHYEDGNSIDMKSEITDDRDCEIIIYNEENEVVYGTAPSSTLLNVSYLRNRIQEINDNGTKYYIYDSIHHMPKHDTIRIRGIASFHTAQIASNSMLKLAFITLPFLIIIAAVGGYLITKRAFLPVSRITDTANMIGTGNDLSKRIPFRDTDLEAGKDEIGTLALTFNDMFDRLQKSFAKERQFTQDASHELRTPTSVIVAQAEYLLSIIDNMEARNAVNVILKQSEKMSNLLAELLLLARMDSGKQVLEMEEFDLSELTNIVLEELEYLTEEKNITFHTDIGENICINANQTMITRMLINLITNAIKFGKQGGTIEIHLYQTGETIHGEVKDNGIGIASNHLERIWDRFFQVDPARTSERGSSGLGLAIVKWIVQAHNGSITVQSELGEGSSFQFTLPCPSSLTRRSMPER
ncbi:MAG TPA: HAMP domain-containing sensor histidine kinase [Lachnospiraceae bacterium]|nr:HAMP domain-containing sensor histidine kinase [Lachnospiraceae bacterium]